MEGLDLAALTAYLRDRVDFAGPLTAEVLSGGRSNLTYSLKDGQHRWVLRRPPLGHVLASAHDMGREFRAMSALGSSSVPVPRTVVHCTNLDVLGVEFYVMDFVDGTIHRSPEQIEAITDPLAVVDNMVDALVALHQVEPADVGLVDFGRPVGYAERQVRTWTRQLAASYSRDLPDLMSLSERLAQHVPHNPRHTIVHGDYRLDNVVVADDLSIAAILDWEMSTLGDPLTDVASMAVWWDGLKGLDSPVAAVPGEHLDVASTDLIARYAQRSGTEPEDLSWYLAFAYFKLAAIFEGIHYRFQQGQTVGEGFDRMGALVQPMTDSGHRELDARG